MKDSKRGLYNKYSVVRMDGKAKHDNCRYFVLDLSHDPFAYKAIAAYVRACSTEYPALADDLRDEMGKMGKGK